MDIVFEIFSLLDPMDLLNLARTTKEFRGLLVLPRDLSEPQYADLYFLRNVLRALFRPFFGAHESAFARNALKQSGKPVRCLFQAYNYPFSFSIGPSQYNSTFRYEICLYKKKLVPSYQKPPRDWYRRGGGQFFSWDVFSKLRAECVRFAAPRKTLDLAILQDPKYKEWYKQKFEEMKEKDAAFIEVCTPQQAARSQPLKCSEEIHPNRWSS
ncbi:hypothetical protein B0H14DRAFT_3140247 [Mycena olivaceomarginata]|nr:hypothetical protein B0H14DRAFT_3140247 [Mycena olivaceomarginata]